MKWYARILFLFAAVLSITSRIDATTGPLADREYTNAEIQKLAREAHTVEQYTILADYYATRQRAYKHKAAEEMQLWAERNTRVNSVYEKWPRPVDSARNLHEYYEYKADEAAKLKAKYSRLADEVAAQ